MNVFVTGNVCIYVLLENGKRVRYIGITNRRLELRLLQHYSEAYRTASTHKTRWIRKCLAEDIPVTIHRVKSGLSRAQAERMELQLIRFFGKAFKLVNSTSSPVFKPRPKVQRWVPLEIGLRNKASGEIVWTDLRSVRSARKWISETAKRLASVQRFYQ